MSYEVQHTVEGIRFVFSRGRFSKATWVLGGATAAAWVGYFNTPSRHSYYLLWPCVFLGLLVASILMNEIIEIDHEYLSKCTIFLGLTWTARYELAGVMDPHYEPERGYGRNRIPSCLSFQYRGKTRSILSNIQPSEVEDILTEIVRRFPDLAGRWKTQQQLYGSTDITTINI